MTKLHEVLNSDFRVTVVGIGGVVYIMIKIMILIKQQSFSKYFRIAGYVGTCL